MVKRLHLLPYIIKHFCTFIAIHYKAFLYIMLHNVLRCGRQWFVTTDGTNERLQLIQYTIIDYTHYIARAVVRMAKPLQL